MARRPPTRRQKDAEGALLVQTLALVALLDAHTLLNLRVNAGLVVPCTLVSITLLIVFISVYSPLKRDARLDWARSPWVLSALLLGVPWTGGRLDGQGLHPVVEALILLALAGVVVLLWHGVRYWIEPAVTTESRLLSPVWSSCLLVVGVLAFNMVCQQRPLVTGRSEGSGPGTSSGPNVILLVLDTVRADHLSLYGYPRDTSPNLKRVAAGATTFLNAVSTSDVTLSAHASLFTGLYANRHGAHFAPPNQPIGNPLEETFDTLAEHLSRRGYLTWGVAANTAFLSPFFGLNQGFQYYDNRLPVPLLGPTPAFFLRGAVRDYATRFFSSYQFDLRYRRAEEINQTVFGLLDGVGKSDRFFLFVNYMDAHSPYLPPPPFDRLFAGKDDHFLAKDYDDLVVELYRYDRPVTDKEFSHLTSQYDGGIAYLDYQVGQLILRLKKLGLYDQSLVLITSDHGETFGRRRHLIGHAVSVYQDQIHVPLIIKYPGQKRGRVVRDTVSLVDLMPTILARTESTVPKVLQGRNLANEGRGAPRTILSESFQNGLIQFWIPRLQRVQQALFSGTEKLIVSTSGQRELFDLATDPDEQNNLFDPGDQETARMLSELQERLQESASSRGVDRPPDKVTIERLRSLGYIR
ncbi:MAG: sulfatase-like hydrolase/transferase [Acidobacteriota bacterium]